MNQRSCKLTERLKACDNGLIHRVFKKRCVAPKGKLGKLYVKAKEKARQVAPLVKDFALTFAGIGRSKDMIKTLKRLGKARNARDFEQIIYGQPRLKTTLQLLQAFGFKSMTVGVSSGGALGVGLGLETGASIDTNRQKSAVMYQSKAKSGGVQFAVGNDLAVSGYISQNNCIGGPPALGVSVSADVGTGYGAILWFDKSSHRFIGFSSMIGAGSVGGGVAIVESKTDVYGGPRC